MLRASCKANEIGFDLAVISDPDTDSGIAFYRELLGFAVALLEDDVKTLKSARQKLHLVAGDTGVMRAAAVVGNFQMMNRALDTLGAQLGKGLTPDMVALADILDMSVPEHWP